MRHLDTNVVSALMSGERAAELRFTRHYPRLALSAIALAELRFGVANSGRPAANMRKLHDVLQYLDVVSFDEKCAAQYGALRKALEDDGRPLRDADLFIAASALAHNAILVTHNTRHFADIDGLQLEDWLA